MEAGNSCLFCNGLTNSRTRIICNLCSIKTAGEINLKLARSKSGLYDWPRITYGHASGAAQRISLQKMITRLREIYERSS